METGVTGTFLNRPCWLPVLHTEDWEKSPKNTRHKETEQSNITTDADFDSVCECVRVIPEGQDRPIAGPGSCLESQ